MRKIGVHVVYVAGLLLLVILSVKYLEEMRLIASREYYPLPSVVGSSVCSMLIGAYIALPRLLHTLKGTGRIQVDWLKLLIVGVPAFLVSISGVLSYSMGPSTLTTMAQWVFLKVSATGTVYMGIACGYTLLSCIAKAENSDAIPKREVKGAKILFLTLLGVCVLYFSLSNVIHPMKLIDVHADIVVRDDQSGYQLENGKDTVFFVQTEITYRFDFKNLPHRIMRGYSPDNSNIWVEPKETLANLVENDVFQQYSSRGFGGNGDTIELTLDYTIGSIDPEGKHQNIDPPSPEVLKKIKNSLYDAELVIQFSEGETKRYNLLDYKKN
ncbi:hypothetical protein [Desulfitobacterium hafniense]|uniref:Uncharacterized protein n=1 Tax=Desulfitobacterium hafniense (strain Y51) TaxID=138119 RepID=Q24PZ6_DESHY|nr:hypothetical protein [Desulfitobacterium hafniense]BAE85896.1 hypothetical protein DSY4107 [Desulfitobacterium hafniense Y51]